MERLDTLNRLSENSELSNAKHNDGVALLKTVGNNQVNSMKYVTKSLPRQINCNKAKSKKKEINNNWST